MIVLGLDTATPSTVAGVLLADGRVVEARDDPAADSRGAHAAKLLVLAEQALAEAGVGWEAVDRLAVGVGPGGFTGLRIGIATARALAQARGLPLVPVSSLAALAAGATPAANAPGTAPPPLTAAVIDARRGEVFAAAWQGAERLLDPVAIDPAELAASLGAGRLAGPLAAGDGSVRFRELFERAGALVPADRSPAHRVSALQVCRLGAAGDATDRDRLVPDYRREPDAKPRP